MSGTLHPRGAAARPHAPRRRSRPGEIAVIVLIEAAQQLTQRSNRIASACDRAALRS